MEPRSSRLLAGRDTLTVQARYKQLRFANHLAERWCRAHLHRQVRDPELRRKLTPDYSFGCKRPTFSNDYFRVFTKPHVRLETSTIERIDATGVVTADGNRCDIDVLVLATGFNLWDTNFPAFQVIGRDGKDLGAWRRQHRFQAYEGVTVPGFPNYLSLNSPYSYSGLSYFTTIECQMKHMRRLFTALHDRGADIFEVTGQANDQFLHRMRTKVAQDSVFPLGQCATARSYYFNQHGEATLLRPSSTIAAHRAASRFPLEHYTFTSVRTSASPGRRRAPSRRTRAEPGRARRRRDREPTAPVRREHARRGVSISTSHPDHPRVRFGHEPIPKATPEAIDNTTIRSTATR